MKILAIYDISDDLVRNAVSSLFQDWGGKRLQLSAFTLELDKEEAKLLISELNELLLPKTKEFSVRLYPLCRPCATKEIVISDRPKDKKEEGFYIF